MKTIFTLGIVLLLSMLTQAQNNPNCSHLAVESIQMDNDTTKLIKIAIGNNCQNCASGIAGCVYMELRVISTVAPFDTIASSSCWCKWSPNNNGQKLYTINSKVASLPNLSQIRVSLGSNACGCDTIPFKTAVGLLRAPGSNEYDIFPNPGENSLTISNPENKETLTEIRDTAGRMVLSSKSRVTSQSLDITALAKGIYFVNVSDTEGETRKTFKIIKN